jgi:hypothetical protein
MQAAPTRSSNGFFRDVLEDARRIRTLARGLMSFSRTGQTPDDAYHSLIWLHCRTNGRSNDILHAFARRRYRPATLPAANGVLGDLTTAQVELTAAEIRETGSARFPQLLSPEICQRLVDLSLRTEAVVTPAREGYPKRAVYDRAHPMAEGFKFEEWLLMPNTDIQRLIADPSVLALAQAYLGCLPVLSAVSLWWSTSARFASSAQADLAQMYHFDMDHIKWLKIFFYLTDVTPQNGPHCFIARSHRAGRQPRELLKRGYVRISDSDLESRYPKEDRIEFTGPQGSIFAVDTRGFHKGVSPQTGDRLVLSLEFADSLFGGSYARPPWPADCVAELAARRRDFPRVYSRFS